VPEPRSLSSLSRREFLKISALGAGAFLLDPPPWNEPQGEVPTNTLARARVTTQAIYRYREPSFRSERLGMLKRDELIQIKEEITSSKGPAYNPLWYRLEQGFAHSGYLQRLDGARLNLQPLRSVPKAGQLAEVTVPITRSYRQAGAHRWTPLYTLYYQSVHWITAVEEGLDGEIWYRLTDDVNHVQTFVQAAHLRPITPEEVSPLAQDVPDGDKRIEISIEKQHLTAFEGDRAVLQASISTGMQSEGPSPNGIPTETPLGYFRVQTKMPSRHMGNGVITDDVDTYELPGVPWVCFFHKDGIALHGTYWHNNFGRRMSHGCVNLNMQDALWIYRWTTPLVAVGEWYARDWGTRLSIQE
jgi:lipoprotein-anchoring transpeptidase ErfK/SrfK